MKTALVVDNSRFVRSYIKEILRENGIEMIAEAENVQEAIQAYRAHKPDLVTLDIVMPDGSGLKVLEEIRAQNADARVVIVSDVARGGTHQKAIDLGAAAILSKPLTSDGLKAVLARMAGAPAAAKEAQPAAKPRALVIDDSAVMRSIIRGMLEEHGFEVIGEACDVQEGIGAYASLQPDLTTVDLVMPGGSGMDVLKAIRAQNRNARVIMVTSVNQVKVKEELLSLGAQSVLHKPVTVDELKAALQLGIPQADLARITAQEAETLKDILQTGSKRCVDALGIMCNAPWVLSGIELFQGSDEKPKLLISSTEPWESVSIRMTVATDVPMICLFVASRPAAQRMAALMTRDKSPKGPSREVVDLATLEWGNIMITNILNVFADTAGSAILSSPPSLMQSPIPELIMDASHQICDLPGRVVLAQNEFSCAGLGIDCVTLFVLHADCLKKFIGGHNGRR